MSNTCEDMCKASIFSCLDVENDPLQKRTWIKITSWKYAGLYLQNPTGSMISDNWEYKIWSWKWLNGWKCNTGKLYKCPNPLWWEYDCILGDYTDLRIKTTCSDWFYCSGTYYGNWYRQWVSELIKSEYENDCVAWTWETGDNSVKNLWSKYVYSDTLSHTWSDPCICKVDYQYSYEAWWIIEWWNCWWLNSDYTAKDENLIYWQWTWFIWQSWSNITWLNWRVWGFVYFGDYLYFGIFW